MTTALEQRALNSANIIPGTLDSEQIPDVAKAAQNGGVWPKFFHRPIQNKAKSEEAGRPVHDQVEWVDIIVAGDRNSKVSRKVSDIDKQRWPAQYQAFKSGNKMPLQGTPLEQWTQLGTDQVADLKSLGIMTVEMLAGLSDDQVANYGLGGHQLREKANAYIEIAANQAAPQHYAADNQRLSEEVIDLKRQLEETHAVIQANEPGADPAEVADLKDRLSQNKLLIDTQAMALEGTKATITNLETSLSSANQAMMELQAKVDEQNQVIGTQKAEIAKLKKPSGKKSTAAKKE